MSDCRRSLTARSAAAQQAVARLPDARERQSRHAQPPRREMQRSPASPVSTKLTFQPNALPQPRGADNPSPDCGPPETTTPWRSHSETCDHARPREETSLAAFPQRDRDPSTIPSGKPEAQRHGWRTTPPPPQGQVDPPRNCLPGRSPRPCHRAVTRKTSDEGGLFSESRTRAKMPASGGGFGKKISDVACLPWGWPREEDRPPPARIPAAEVVQAIRFRLQDPR